MVLYTVTLCGIVGCGAIYSNTVCDERGPGLLVELHGIM